MKNIPIWLKSVICGSVYMIFSLLIIPVAYTLDFFEGTFILGILCGTIIAFVTICDNLNRTIIARVLGIVSAVVGQLILFISGIPYEILLYIFRNDAFVRETGRLTVNELISYNWGVILLLLLWSGLLISLAVIVVVGFIFNLIKRKRAG